MLQSPQGLGLRYVKPMTSEDRPPNHRARRLCHVVQSHTILRVGISSDYPVLETTNQPFSDRQKLLIGDTCLNEHFHSQ